MKKLTTVYVILFLFLILLAQARAYEEQNNPLPPIETLILDHTSHIENYDWSKIYRDRNLGGVCKKTPQRDMCHVKDYAEAYSRNVSLLKQNMRIPNHQEIPSLIQSVWLNQSEDVSVDNVWRTLMSFLKTQKAMLELKEFLGESASDSRTTLYRGVTFPHLSSTLNNFSVFHRVLSYEQGLKVAGKEKVFSLSRNMLASVLKYAFRPYGQSLTDIQTALIPAPVADGNFELLKLRQMHSLAKIYEGLKGNLNKYSVREMSIFESIDSFESLPPQYYVYVLFLKENQERVVQNLEKEQLQMMFSLILLSDLLKFNSDIPSYNRLATVPMNETMIKIGNQIRTEIQKTIAAYQKFSQYGLPQ